MTPARPRRGPDAGACRCLEVGWRGPTNAQRIGMLIGSSNPIARGGGAADVPIRSPGADIAATERDPDRWHGIEPIGSNTLSRVVLGLPARSRFRKQPRNSGCRTTPPALQVTMLGRREPGRYVGPPATSGHRQLTNTLSTFALAGSTSHCGSIRILDGSLLGSRHGRGGRVDVRFGQGQPRLPGQESLFVPAHTNVPFGLYRRHRNPRRSFPGGTTCALGLTLGTSTPCEWIRCGFGQGTRVASRCMYSNGDITRCVVPSRHGVFSFSTTRPAAMHCTRS